MDNTNGVLLESGMCLANVCRDGYLAVTRANQSYSNLMAASRINDRPASASLCSLDAIKRVF
jgi:hypothetical protein